MCFPHDEVALQAAQAIVEYEFLQPGEARWVEWVRTKAISHIRPNPQTGVEKVHSFPHSCFSVHAHC